jgi:hypothetical protein
MTISPTKIHAKTASKTSHPGQSESLSREMPNRIKPRSAKLKTVLAFELSHEEKQCWQQ